MNYKKVAERYNITQIAPDSGNLINLTNDLKRIKSIEKMENSGILKSRKTRGRTWKESFENFS